MKEDPGMLYNCILWEKALRIYNLKLSCTFIFIIIFLIKPPNALIFPNLFLSRNYMFRTVPLPIIRSSPLYIRYWYMSCKCDDSFQARSEWNWFYSVACRYWLVGLNTYQQQNKTSSILNVLESCDQTCMTYTSAKCTVENSWRWTEELPETCRISWQNKFGKISASVSFIKKKFVTMHGHMNTKKFSLH